MLSSRYYTYSVESPGIPRLFSTRVKTDRVGHVQLARNSMRARAITVWP